MTDLDSILSGQGNAAPEQQPPAQPEPQAEAQTEEQPEQQPETEGGKQPPIGAIRQAEREKATKRYTEQVAEFDKRLDETNRAWDRRFQQLVATLKPQQPQPEPQDFFANPDAAVQQAIQPVIRHIGTMSEFVSRKFAITEHGKDSVDAAYQAMERAFQNGDPNAMGEYQRIMNSGDTWGELVRWHKRNIAQQEIGDDVEAFRERERERIRAEILAEQNGQPTEPNGQQPAPRPTNLPSNLTGARNVGTRSGPAWTGPKSLNDIFARK